MSTMTTLPIFSLPQLDDKYQRRLASMRGFVADDIDPLLERVHGTIASGYLPKPLHLDLDSIVQCLHDSEDCAVIAANVRSLDTWLGQVERNQRRKVLPIVTVLRGKLPHLNRLLSELRLITTGVTQYQNVERLEQEHSQLKQDYDDVHNMAMALCKQIMELDPRLLVQTARTAGASQRVRTTVQLVDRPFPEALELAALRAKGLQWQEELAAAEKARRDAEERVRALEERNAALRAASQAATAHPPACIPPPIITSTSLKRKLGLLAVNRDYSSPTFPMLVYDEPDEPGDDNTESDTNGDTSTQTSATEILTPMSERVDPLSDEASNDTCPRTPNMEHDRDNALAIPRITVQERPALLNRKSFPPTYSTLEAHTISSAAKVRRSLTPQSAVSVPSAFVTWPGALRKTASFNAMRQRTVSETRRASIATGVAG